MKLKSLLDFIKDKLGPYEEYDEENNKLLCGNLENEISKVYFCWRLTSSMLHNLDLNKGVLIVCHEPLIADIKYVLTGLTGDEFISSNKEKNNIILATGVNIARFHLSLDSSIYGTNQSLIKRLNLIEKQRFRYFSICELLKSQLLKNFVKKIKQTFEIDYVQVTGDLDKEIKKILVVAGGGANKEFVSFAIHSGCDAVLSGDSYMESRYLAYENNLVIIDPGHQELEVPGVYDFSEIIRTALAGKNIKVQFIKNDKIEHVW